ncbi:MAG: diguanylate cyclase domain protein [Gammaproteobacteria bacterium]|nr:diguanylate cyclase domain protein [Gammaproteobacteria bacterium]
MTRLVPGSIVARTTLTILALSLALGLIFAGVASVRAQKNEERRLQVGLQELLATVESTTRIACFLGDATLAKEIGQGLLSDHVVTGVRVVAGNHTLYQTPRLAENLASRFGVGVISRQIYSPFDAAERVGEISLFTSDAEIRSQARRYSWNIALVLGLQVAFVAAGVALVVFLLITRPISGISNELHRLQLSTGMHLRIPPGNQSDEIGRLVSDVNALITRLTSLLHTERELRIEHEVQERKLKLIFDKAETGLFVLESNGVVQSWNPAFVRILHLGHRVPPPDVGPQRLHELLAPHERSVDELLQRCLTTRTPCEIDLEISRSGAMHSAWIELSLNPISPAILQGVINDVTDRKRLELSARRLAAHDALTGLLNRHGMASSLADLFEHSSPKRLRETAVLQIDLDFFKQVNDAYGHEGGDRVLCHVARVLADTVRRSDLVGRQGGDEFSAVLVGIEASAKALEIANSMIAKIRQPIDLGGGNWAQVSASIGIAFSSSTDDTPATVLRRADTAMYEAKQRGRSQAYVAPSPTTPEPGSAATLGAAKG